MNAPSTPFKQFKAAGAEVTEEARAAAESLLQEKISG